MGRDDPNYAITRIDLDAVGTHGWQVRLQRLGKRYSVLFSDGIYGSSRKSLEAARAWRDDLLESIDKQRLIQRDLKKSKRNSSGVVGVSRVTVRTKSASYEFWQATWTPADGKRKCVKFSITRYGSDEAFALAVEARKKAVGGRGR